MTPKNANDSDTWQFLRFLIVGGLGFLIDTAVLILLHRELEVDAYSARVISSFVAINFTWAGNRHYAFRSAIRDPAFAQWRLFMGVNFASWLVNYGVYATIFATIPLAQEHPIVAIAAGSVAALFVNFGGFKAVVFRMPPASGE